MRRRRAAFTLIELLVVIGIIAVLAALLFPVFGIAREYSNRAVCASNLRQWMFAAQMHANANKGFLPRRGQGVNPTMQVHRPADWFNALPPMLKMPSYSDMVDAGTIPRPEGTHSIWICPTARAFPGDYYWSYGMNMALSVEQISQNNGQPDTFTGVGQTSILAFMADAPGNYCSIYPSKTPGGYNPVARHRGYVNIAFLDGHVAPFLEAYAGINSGAIDQPDLRWKPPRSTWNSAQ